MAAICKVCGYVMWIRECGSVDIVFKKKQREREKKIIGG